MSPGLSCKVGFGFIPEHTAVWYIPVKETFSCSTCLTLTPAYIKDAGSL